MKDVKDIIGNTWIQDDRLRKKFWATLKGEGYTEKEIHDALKVDSLKQYEGSFDDAIAEVRRVGEFTEARFTGTWKGLYRGGELFVCVRDDKDEDGMRRLEALMPDYAHAYDAPTDDAPAGVAESEAQQDEGPELSPVVCIKHNTPMSMKTGQYGKFHSHQQGDGWCPGYKPCPIHNMDMKLHTNKDDGSTWYSHELADKTWCYGGADDNPQADQLPDEDEIPF